MRTVDWIRPGLGDMNGWQARHRLAVRRPWGLEVPIVQGLQAWLDYAGRHQAHYESGIGENNVLGPFWARWGRALHGLLDGDCGRLDGGSLSALIHDTLAEQGFWEEA